MEEEKCSEPVGKNIGCKTGWGEGFDETKCSICDLPPDIKERCQCFPNYDIKLMENCDPELSKIRLESDQMCGYIDDEGLLKPCQAGCCEGKGCPGQCCDGTLGVPDKKRPITRESSQKEYYIKIMNKEIPLSKIFTYAIYIIIVSIIFSTLSAI